MNLVLELVFAGRAIIPMGTVCALCTSPPRLQLIRSVPQVAHGHLCTLGPSVILPLACFSPA